MTARKKRTILVVGSIIAVALVLIAIFIFTSRGNFTGDTFAYLEAPIEDKFSYSYEYATTDTEHISDDKNLEIEDVGRVIRDFPWKSEFNTADVYEENSPTVTLMDHQSKNLMSISVVESPYEDTFGYLVFIVFLKQRLNGSYKDTIFASGVESLDDVVEIANIFVSRNYDELIFLNKTEEELVYSQDFRLFEPKVFWLW